MIHTPPQPLPITGPGPERSDAVNWSTLRAMRVSPRHYLHALTTERPDTDALRLGRALHAAVYEPDRFAREWIVQPRFHRGQKDDTAILNGYDGGREAAAAWDAARGTAEVITAEVQANVAGMLAAIRADPVASGMVMGGVAEQPVEWVDVETGISCRGRIDHVRTCVTDLKSTARLERFVSSAASLGYHAQLAFYADGLAAVGVELPEDPCLISVESVAPFDVVVYRFRPEQLAIGRAVYRRCLDRLAECRASGVWPGVSGGSVVDVALPAWAAPAEELALTLDGESLF